MTAFCRRTTKFTRRARETLISKPTLPPARVQRLVRRHEVVGLRRSDCNSVAEPSIKKPRERISQPADAVSNRVPGHNRGIIPRLVCRFNSEQDSIDTRAGDEHEVVARAIRVCFGNSFPERHVLVNDLSDRPQ